MKNKLSTYFSSFIFHLSSLKGFTLIELLIVIAVLGVLSAGVLTAINITGNLNKANLAKAKTFSASIENSLSINQVGKWSFEDGTGATTFKDTSGNGNDSLPCSGISCPTWTTSIDCNLGFGGCLKFDGTGNYIDLGNPVSLTLAKTITVAVWVNPDALSSDKYIVTRGNTGTNGWMIYENQPGQITIWLSTISANTQAVLLNALSAKKWTHIAFTYDGSKLLLYVDGVLAPSQPSITGDIKYGAITNTMIAFAQNGASTRRFNGMLDEVAIYNQALTAYQIQQLYAQGLPRHQLARW